MTCFHPSGIPAWVKDTLGFADSTCSFETDYCSTRPRTCSGTGVSAAVEILFSNLKDPHLCEERLGLFEKVRLPKVTLTKIAFNAEPGPHTLSEVEAEVGNSIRGRSLCPMRYHFRQPFHDFSVGYDVFEEVRKALI